jgi:hypothetical protein
MWIEKVNNKMTEKMIPNLNRANMLLPMEVYSRLGIENGLNLARMSDFNTLVAKSQEYQTPVYELTKEQLGQTGIVYERTAIAQDTFRNEFSRLAEKFIALTS